MNHGRYYYKSISFIGMRILVGLMVIMAGYSFMRCLDMVFKIF